LSAEVVSCEDTHFHYEEECVYMLILRTQPREFLELVYRVQRKRINLSLTPQHSLVGRPLQAF